MFSKMTSKQVLLMVMQSLFIVISCMACWRTGTQLMIDVLDRHNKLLTCQMKQKTTLSLGRRQGDRMTERNYSISFCTKELIKLMTQRWYKNVYNSFYYPYELQLTFSMAHMFYVEFQSFSIGNKSSEFLKSRGKRRNTASA